MEIPIQQIWGGAEILHLCLTQVMLILLLCEPQWSGKVHTMFKLKIRKHHNLGLNPHPTAS